MDSSPELYDNDATVFMPPKLDPFFDPEVSTNGLHFIATKAYYTNNAADLSFHPRTVLQRC